MRSNSLFLVSALVLALPACTETSSPAADDGAAARFHVARSASWGPAVPVNGTAMVNTNSEDNEFSPSYSPAAGGMLFFSSDRVGPHGIYVSRRGANGSWQTPVRVDELNLGFTAFRPNVSANGREIVFDSNRPGSTGLDIWYSHRATPHSAWAEPVRLSDASINSTANETRASMSRDGRRLYFGSNRGGNLDLYVAERR